MSFPGESNGEAGGFMKENPSCRNPEIPAG